jgi:acetolactate synthase-1/2/3 large subunit
MSIPDIARVTTAYGINTFAIDTHDDLESVIPRVLEWNGPAVCTLRIPPDSPVEPRIGFAKNPDGTMAAKPLEDMAPFLDRDEFHHAMIVKPVA